jgi:hypothetical protein
MFNNKHTTLDINMTDLNYLIGKIGEGFILPSVDKYRLERLSVKMAKNTKQHVELIVAMAKNYIAGKNTNPKRYQVNSYHAYKKISAELDELGIKHEIITGELTHKKLSYIYGSASGCCRDCDVKMTFYHDYEPNLYVKIYRQ